MPWHSAGMLIRELTEPDTEAFLALKRRGLSTDPEAFVASLEDDAPSYPEEVSERLRHASVASGDIVLGAFAPHLIGIIAIRRIHGRNASTRQTSTACISCLSSEAEDSGKPSWLQP